MDQQDGTGRHDCPEPRQLAAFIDGALDARNRAGVEAHLAECEGCRAVVAGAVETVLDLDGLPRDAGAMPERQPHAPSRRRTFLAAAAGLGVAAAILMAVFLPWPGASDPIPGPDRPELAGLVAAIGDQRPFGPRLTGGFRPGPSWPVMRSGESTVGQNVPAGVRAEAARLAQRAEERPSLLTRAAAASADLVVGRVDQAIAQLEDLTRERPDSAVFWTDLSAACLVRYTQGGDRGWAERGLEAADRALALDARLDEALYNRALALDLLGDADAARRAWRRYDTDYPDSPWRR